jgi:hypothetical protein
MTREKLVNRLVRIGEKEMTGEDETSVAASGVRYQLVRTAIKRRCGTTCSHRALTRGPAHVLGDRATKPRFTKQTREDCGPFGPIGLTRQSVAQGDESTAATRAKSI